MKKLLFLTFLLIYSFNSSAHMAHYNKFNKIEMEILRDGEVIGYNYYFFKKDGKNTTVTNQLKFTVKLLVIITISLGRTKKIQLSQIN